LQFQGTYTYTRNLSNQGGYAPTAFPGESGGYFTDQYHPGLDYGNVAFSRRQRLLITYLYELPFGKGKRFVNSSGLMDRVVGGWEVAGVIVAQTGPFMTVRSSGDPSGTGFDQLVDVGRADTVKGVNPYAGQSINQWINPAAFTTPPDNVGRFANSSVGNVIGPGTKSVSLSIFKTIKFTESVRMQIGASAANLFNHPNYDVPNQLAVDSPGFAALNALQTAEGAGPRQIQLSARIYF
jgi:hypothetical protein